ncbi:MAG: hypothetical protein LWX07_08205 [Bacteroidetes bacterium]|nr:hypothetical protein [Bacteroidota bacterium]
MKRTIIALFVLAAMFVLSQAVQAQSYFTYDGKDFSVLLTCNTDNSQVIKVEFSENGKWVGFDILDYTSLENVEGGGFAYTVKDGAGKKFLVDYYRTQDYIKVVNLDTNDEWTLNRR